MASSCGNLGVIYQTQGDLEKAEASFKSNNPYCHLKQNATTHLTNKHLIRYLRGVLFTLDRTEPHRCGSGGSERAAMEESMNNIDLLQLIIQLLTLVLELLEALQP